MTHLICSLLLIPLSAVGPTTFWWLLTHDPDRIRVRLRVPETVAGPMTLNSDTRGLA